MQGQTGSACSVPEKDSSDLQRWAPLVLQDVQADAAQLVDVWVVDLCEKTDLPQMNHVAHSIR